MYLPTYVRMHEVFLRMRFSDRSPDIALWPSAAKLPKYHSALEIHHLRFAVITAFSTAPTELHCSTTTKDTLALQKYYVLLASSPGPSPREKGLVHTDCACVVLYPESGYIVYFRKILCKLIIYDYVICLFLLAYHQQTY